MSKDKKIQELIEAAAKREATPPEPEEEQRPMEDAGSQALSESLKSSVIILKVIVVLLILFFFRSLIFTVPTQERAVILRFGRPVVKKGSILLEPGAHWAFPYPIDEIVRIPQEEIQTIYSSVGWYMDHAVWQATQQEPPAYPYLDPASESYTLTADTNIIHVRAVLKYRITDPRRYTFGFAGATNMVQNVLDSALYHASARFTVDEALRLNVKGFEEEVMDNVQRLVDEYDLGITLEPSSVVSIPPRYLKDAFARTQSAAQESSAKISQARGDAEQSIAKAKGEAANIINQGRTESLRLVRGVQAEADYFQNLLPQYRRDPDLFKNRLVVEALQRVMTNVYEKFIVVDRADGRPREMRILLNRQPIEPTRGQPE